MISVKHLTKYYGQSIAVDDLSFEIGEGSVYGFLGRNGAGKSTTMNIMTGCLSSTSGEVTIGGYDIFEDTKEAKRLIGYLPEQPPLYMNESALEYLKFVGEAKGLRGAELEYQIEKVIEQTKIEDVLHKRIGALSKGYKQRVGIAQALLGNPKVIILDEPTVGLDPLQIIEIRDLIKNLGKEHTVILSSHVLSEVQEMCDKVLIINKGKLIAFDTPEKLEQELSSSTEITITTSAMETDLADLLLPIGHITEMVTIDFDTTYQKIRLKTDYEDPYFVSKEIFLAFAHQDKVVYEMNVKKVNLEDIFIGLTEEKAEDPLPLTIEAEDALGLQPEEAANEAQLQPEENEREAL